MGLSQATWVPWKSLDHSLVWVDRVTVINEWGKVRGISCDKKEVLCFVGFIHILHLPMC